MEKMIKDLEKLVAINSVCRKQDDKDAPFGKEVALALETALSICEGYGLTVKNCENMTAYAQTGSGEELMGILVHLDVVPAGEGWDGSPFELRLEDGKIYGRGVTDDKGPAVAVIHALKELVEEGCRFKRRVRIIFGLAEETGDWDDMEYYKATQEPIDFGFTPDADFPAIYAEMGIANVQFVFDKNDTCFVSIEGGNAANMVPDRCSAVFTREDGSEEAVNAAGRSAHGSTPWDGDNAICNLMEMLASRRDCLLSRFFADCIKKEYDGRSLGGYAKDEKSGEITYNHGLIHTEDDRIILTTDIRYPVTYAIDDILSGIRTRLTEAGLEEVEVELLSDVPFVFSDAEGPVITSLLSAYREHTGDMRPPAVIGGGTYARAMEGVVAFGPMLPGRELTEHQANEYIFAKDLMLAKEIYKTAIKKLAVEI